VSSRDHDEQLSCWSAWLRLARFSRSGWEPRTPLSTRTSTSKASAIHSLLGQVWHVSQFIAWLYGPVLTAFVIAPYQAAPPLSMPMWCISDAATR
jgi:hypothetical protein